MHDSDELDDILNETAKTRTQRIRPRSRSHLRP